MDVIQIINDLNKEVDSLKGEILQSATNKSANRRARKQSVKLRETLKSIRKELLKTEKEMRSK